MDKKMEKGIFKGILYEDKEAGQTPEWLGSAPDNLESIVDEVRETDVVVCGAGIAGVCAARAAAEAGAEVILLEKSQRVSFRSGQFAVIGGQFLKKWKIENEDLRCEIVNHLMRDTSYRADQRILKYFSENIGSDFDWYLGALKEELYCQIGADTPVPEDVKQFATVMQYPPQPKYHLEEERYPCYPYTVQIRPSHGFVLKANLEKGLETNRLKVLYSMPARKLLVNDRNRVIGVIAQGYDSKVIKIIAKRGVILATGDYSGNRQMLKFYCPWLLSNRVIPYGFDQNNQPLNYGDGHKMGMWAGAKMEEGPHGGMAHSMGAAMGMAPFLLLDCDGKRFINEDCPGQQLENRLERIKNHSAWQIFDSHWPEQIEYMPFGHSSPSRVADMEKLKKGEAFFDLTPMDGFASQWFLEASIKSGQTVTSNSLRELCTKAGIPQKNTLESIRRYNQLAHKKCDRDFGKNPQRMFPLEAPPYYASKVSPAILLGTVSGLESDDYSHVLNGRLEIIPGLYAAGNVKGNRMGCEYPTTIPGLSHSMALTFGRAAGRNAAIGR